MSGDKETGVKAAEASVNYNRVRARICLAERVGDHWYDHRPQPHSSLAGKDPHALGSPCPSSTERGTLGQRILPANSSSDSSFPVNRGKGPPVQSPVAAHRQMP